jgi:transposase
MRSLSEVEVARAVALLEDGRSMRFVANILNTSPSVICRLWHRYQITGSYSRRAGQGLKGKTSHQNDRYSVTCSPRRRTATARQLQNLLRNVTGVDISDQTVRSRLREANLTPHRPERALRLQRDHKVARLRFAREHIRWQLRHWRSVTLPMSLGFVLLISMDEYEYTDVLVRDTLQPPYRQWTDAEAVR